MQTGENKKNNGQKQIKGKTSEIITLQRELEESQERQRGFSEKKKILEAKIRELSAEENRLKKERQVFFIMRNGLEKKIQIFNKREGQTKAEKKRIEEEEKKEVNSVKKKIIEKRRWSIEQKRRKIEEEKWKIEDEIKKIERDIRKIEKTITEELNRAKKEYFLEIQTLNSDIEKGQKRELLLEEKIIKTRKLEKEKLRELKRLEIEKEREEKWKEEKEFKKKEEIIERTQEKEGTNLIFNEEKIDFYEIASNDIEEYDRRLRELYEKAEADFARNHFLKAMVNLEIILKNLIEPKEESQVIINEIKRRGDIYSKTRELHKKTKTRIELGMGEEVEPEEKTIEELRKSVFSNQKQKIIEKEEENSERMRSLVREEEEKRENVEKQKKDLEDRLEKESETINEKREELKNIEKRRIEESFIQAEKHLESGEISVARFIVQELLKKLNEENSLLEEITKELNIKEKAEKLLTLVIEKEKEERQKEEQKKIEEDKKKIEEIIIRAKIKDGQKEEEMAQRMKEIKKNEEDRLREEREEIEDLFQKAKEYFRKTNFTVARFIIEDSLARIESEENILKKTKEYPLIEERGRIILEEINNCESFLKNEAKKKEEEIMIKRKEESQKRKIDEERMEKALRAAKEREKQLLEEKRMEELEIMEKERIKREETEKQKRELENRIREEEEKRMEIEKKLEEERMLLEIQKESEIEGIKEEKKILERALRKEREKRKNEQKRGKEEREKIENLLARAKEDYKEGRFENSLAKAQEALSRSPEEENNIVSWLFPSYKRKAEKTMKRAVLAIGKEEEERKKEEQKTIEEIRDRAKKEASRRMKEDEILKESERREKIESLLIEAEGDICRERFDDALVKLDVILQENIHQHKKKVVQLVKDIAIKNKQKQKEEEKNNLLLIKEALEQVTVKQIDFKENISARKERAEKKALREKSFWALEDENEVLQQKEEIERERSLIEKDIQKILSQRMLVKQEVEKINDLIAKAEKLIKKIKEKESAFNQRKKEVIEIIKKTSSPLVMTELEKEKEYNEKTRRILTKTKITLQGYLKGIEKAAKIAIVNEATIKEEMSFFEKELGNWSLDIETRKEKIKNLKKEKELREKEEALKRIQEEEREREEKLKEEQKEKESIEKSEVSNIDEEKKIKDEKRKRIKEEALNRIKKEKEDSSEEKEVKVDISDIDFKV